MEREGGRNAEFYREWESLSKGEKRGTNENLYLTNGGLSYRPIKESATFLSPYYKLS